jgi:tRNA1(Val) A37 N6-methylase TrmN6
MSGSPSPEAAQPDGDVTEDALLGGRVRLLQPRKGYRVAVDPVLLAASVGTREGEVLDAGAGTGAASLCLAVRLPGLRITGLELDAASAGLARTSTALNGLGGRVRVVEGDLLAPPEAIRGRTFDVVVTNPPYLDPQTARPPEAAARRGAHVEQASLAHWLEACLRRLAPRGHLHIVHRADRIDELLAGLSGRAGDVRIFPVWPRADAPAASRVVVRARKAGKGPARLLHGLVLHEAGGRFTEAAEQVLRGAQPLDFAD